MHGEVNDDDNALLAAFRRTAVSDRTVLLRVRLIRRFGFAVPTDQALGAIQRWSQHGVVEVGAGVGYWAHLLDQQGLDVAAFDLEPPPSHSNRWFKNRQTWHPVLRADHTIAEQFPERSLLMIWPPRNTMWPVEAIDRYHAAGGRHVLYVGEGPGGRTGDDVLHARLGELTTCTACTYDVVTAPCVCDIDPQWQWIEKIPLPNWPGSTDQLHVYARRNTAAPRRRWRQALRQAMNYNT